MVLDIIVSLSFIAVNTGYGNVQKTGTVDSGTNLQVIIDYIITISYKIGTSLAEKAW